jgi:hypothetical protein
VFDHAHGDPRDDPGRRTLGGQRAAAAGAGVRLVDHYLVGDGDLPQGAALPPRLTAGLAPGLAAQRLGRRLVQPVGRRRLGGVARGGGQPPLQLRDPRILLGDACLLLAEPGLQLRDDPLLRRRERRQLLARRTDRSHSDRNHTLTTRGREPEQSPQQ